MKLKYEKSENCEGEKPEENPTTINGTLGIGIHYSISSHGSGHTPLVSVKYIFWSDGSQNGRKKREKTMQGESHS